EDDDRWQIESDDFDNKPPGDADAWEKCESMVSKHDITWSRTNGEGIDSLLVFAGLFSAVLTSFVAESYKWLLEEPEDVSTEYLRRILATLMKVELSEVPTSTGRPALPDKVAIVINALWLGSLTLSLASALVGIVSKQWLREYLIETGHAHRTNLAVRQVKFEGLERWYVSTIISSIPLLLQTALFMFLAGVVDLLWHIQPAVAALITALVSALGVFFVVTTVLPGIQYVVYHRRRRLHAVNQFPFKSPQSWFFLKALVRTLNFFARVFASAISLTRRRIDCDERVAPYRIYSSWTQLDLDWTSRRDAAATWYNEPSSIARCFGFMELNFEHAHLRDWIWNCLWHMRDNARDAIYVLQCFRRGPKSHLDLTSPEDGLMHSISRTLDSPRVASRTMAELAMHILLVTGHGSPRAATRLEHTIRMFNTLRRCGRRETRITPMIFTFMNNALSDLSNAPLSTGEYKLRSQLFFVARDILRSSHDEQTDNAPFPLAHAIVAHLCRSETDTIGDRAVRDTMCLDLSNEVREWLGRYPRPMRDHEWSEYKSHVIWSAQIAVELAAHLWRSDPSGSRLVEHPHFTPVYDLFLLIHARVLEIPQVVPPTWEPENFDMDEFLEVKVTLEGLLNRTEERQEGHEMEARRETQITSDSDRTATDNLQVITLAAILH
ncbi:hypothetical protein GGG16DRAFT_53836, partial [Schizophyllum commune]